MRRKIIAIAVLVCSVITVSAQMRTAYFMEGSYFRTDMNAALAPTRGYIKMPALGHIGVDFSNNYFSVNNLFYKKNGGVYTFMNSAVSADEFLKRLGNKGKVSTNVSTSIFGFGAHTDKYFWSVNLALRSNTEVALSKDLFRALKNLSNGYYDLGDTSISNREYLDLSLGAAVPIKDFITVGVRIKGLVGLADISMNMQEMYLNVGEDKVNASLQGSIRGNCPVLTASYLPNSDIRDLVSMGSIGRNLKSWGLGIDIGAEARFLDDRLKVSLALNDLGFIRWYRGSTVNAAGAANFSYAGFNLTTAEANVDSGFDYQLTPSSGAYTSRLTCTLNAGVEYNILDNHIAFGLLSHTQFCQSFTRSELTASVNFRIGRWLSTSLSHTFLNSNKIGVFGWALNIHPTGFNLFIGADFIDTRYVVMDNISLPKMMSSANFYVGLGFNLGKAKYMKSMQPREKRAKKSKSQPKAQPQPSNAPQVVI